VGQPYELESDEKRPNQCGQKGSKSNPSHFSGFDKALLLKQCKGICWIAAGIGFIWLTLSILNEGSQEIAFLFVLLGEICLYHGFIALG
jgi:hypothetical protein